MKTLPGLDEGSAVTKVLLDARADDLGLVVDLLLGGVRVDFAEDPDGLLELVLAKEEARRLGEVAKHAELKKGREGAKSDLVTPAVRDVLESEVEDVGDDLAARDGDNVQSDETTTESGGREFTDVKAATEVVRPRTMEERGGGGNARNNERSQSDTETDDKATDRHDPVGALAERNGLKNCEEGSVRR